MSESKEVLIPAGFGVRLVAIIIDGIILMIPSNLVSVSLSVPEATTFDITHIATRALFGGLITGLYAGYCYSQLGATLGKKVMKIKVVDQNTGSRISFLRGFFRDTIGHWVSALPMCLGYLWVVFDKEKRSLHDHIFDTRVVKIESTAAFAYDNVSGAAPVNPPDDDPFRG